MLLISANQAQLQSEINKLNNLQSWGSWDVVVVSDGEIQSVVEKSFESLQNCPDRSLSFSLLQLIKRIKSDEYITPKLKDLANQIQPSVYQSIDLLGENDIQPLILKLLHSHENHLVSYNPSATKNLGSVSKRWREVYENEKEQWDIIHRDLKMQEYFPLKCKNGAEAINIIIENNLVIADLSNHSDITNELLENLFKKHKNIEHLIITGTQVTKLPAKCRSLQTLECSFLPITELPEMPNLTTLKCVDCLLTKLPNLPNLYSLECQFCPLTMLPNLPNLYFLDCSNCDQITALPDLPNLEKLYCFDCPLLLKLSNIPKVKVLHCYNCPKLIEPANIGKRFPNCREFKFKEK